MDVPLLAGVPSAKNMTAFYEHNCQRSFVHDADGEVESIQGSKKREEAMSSPA